MNIKTLLLTDILIDQQLQTRAAMNAEVVKEYQEAIEAMQEFPPVTVFNEGKNYFLADGWHRIRAYRNLDRDRISAKVYVGSHRDAFLHALSANAEHGLRRSQFDKRRAVQMALEDKEIGQKTNREIAKLCRVSHTYVNRVRESLKPKAQSQELASKTSNWPKSEAKVETFPPDTPDEDESYGSYTELDEALDTNAALAEEIERLNDRLAVSALAGTEEEKAQAAATIESLRTEVKLLTVERDSLRFSRDTCMNENAELKSQCAKYSAVIKKLNKQLEQLETELQFYRAVEGAS